LMLLLHKQGEEPVTNLKCEAEMRARDQFAGGCTVTLMFTLQATVFKNRLHEVSN